VREYFRNAHMRVSDSRDYMKTAALAKCNNLRYTTENNLWLRMGKRQRQRKKQWYGDGDIQE